MPPDMFTATPLDDFDFRRFFFFFFLMRYATPPCLRHDDAAANIACRAMTLNTLMLPRRFSDAAALLCCRLAIFIGAPPPFRVFYAICTSYPRRDSCL